MGEIIPIFFYLNSILTTIQPCITPVVSGDSWYGNRGELGRGKTLSSSQLHKGGVLQDRSEGKFLFSRVTSVQFQIPQGV